MKKAIVLALVFSSLVGCAHNYADAYVAATAPKAERTPVGKQAVIAVYRTSAVICFANEQHETTCQPLIGMQPAPQKAEAIRVPGPGPDPTAHQASSSPGTAPVPKSPPSSPSEPPTDAPKDPPAKTP